MTTSLSVEEQALRMAIDFVPQGLAVFDADFRLVASNSRYRSLLNLPEQLVFSGTPLIDIALHLARRGDFGDGDPATLATARSLELANSETTVSRRSGTSGQVLEFHSSRLPGGGLVVTFVDVTARVEAEMELERVAHSLEGRVEERTAALTRVNAELENARAKADAANRDKTRFLAAASHDLLQPLNAARLYTATLVERAGGGSLGELAGSIEASLNAVEEIMSALLDISRIDSGALRPAAAVVGVRDLQRKIEIEFSPLAREKQVQLRLVESSRSVVSDRALVGRILQNLVSNAIKYTRPGGRILVGCRLRGTRIRIDVIDTGIGFNRDQHALIFAEFSRLEQGARLAPGLGLGLSIVRRLVNALGVTLELDSVESKGSRFSLYLASTRARVADVSETTASEPASSLAGLKVLCVDNERLILEALSGLLEGWACDVKLARSLKDIDREQLLVGWLPDIVLMDYHLDQTSGLDAIEWLRQNVGGHLPAVLITADHSPLVRRLATERDIPVITKPVKPAALRATLNRLVGGGPRQVDARSSDKTVSN